MGNNETKRSGPVFLLGDFTKASESMISEIRNKFERPRALGVLVPFAVALWRPNHASSYSAPLTKRKSGPVGRVPATSGRRAFWVP